MFSEGETSLGKDTPMFSEGETSLGKDAPILREEETSLGMDTPMFSEEETESKAEDGNEFKAEKHCSWEGWHAAFIAFKRQETLPAVTQDDCTEMSETNETIKRVSESVPVSGSFGSKLDKDKCYLGKRKVRETLESEWKDINVNEDGMDYSRLSEDCKVLKEGVEALSIHVFLNIDYMFDACAILGWSSYKSFKESVFRSIANFVISLFDKEDFQRIFCDDKKKAEWEKLSSRLSELQFDPKTAKKVASVMVEKEFHEFPSLTEHDFCDMLRQYAEYVDEHSSSRENEFVVKSFKAHLFYFDLGSREVDICKSVMSAAIENAMHNHSTLKEDSKVQLALELMTKKGYQVFDSLLIEFFKGMKVDDLLKLVDKESTPEEDRLFEEEYRFSSAGNFVAAVLLKLLLILDRLGQWKSEMLNYSQNAVAFPLSSIFGPCEAEVLEVIKIAEHERRLREESYISLEHVELGLYLSRVGDFVKKVPGNKGQKCSGGVPLELFIIRMSSLSRQAADALGSEVIGLEHLILAIDYMRRGGEEGTSLVLEDDASAERLESLRNSNAKSAPASSSGPREVWNESSQILKLLPESYDVDHILDNHPIIPFLRKLHSDVMVGAIRQKCEDR